MDWTITPPQVPTMTEAAGQMMQLRHLHQQGQMQNLQLQEAQIGLQNAQRDQADQQIMRQSYMDSGGDMNQYQKLLMQRGASAKAIQGANMQRLDMQTKLAGLTKDQLENQAKGHDAARGAFGSYFAQPAEAQTPESWQQTVENQHTMHNITDDDYAHLRQGHPTPPAGDAQKLILNSFATGTQLADEEAKRRTADAAAIRAKASEDTAATGARKLELETPELRAKAEVAVRANAAAQLGAAKTPEEYGQILSQLPYAVAKVFEGKTPEQARMLGMNPEQQSTVTSQTAARKETARHNKADEGLSGARLGVERGRLAVEQARYGFETSGGISPTAQMAADGRMDPQTIRSILRTNPGLIGQIRQVDPNFDMANLDNRYQTLKEFSNTSVGKAGGQALALNTLIHHADLYMQAGEALKNGTFRPGNAVYNAVATAFGSAPPTNAALIGRFFAGETGKVATGGVPAEGEINGILKNLSTDSSPEQIQNAGKTLLQIAAGRATPLLEKAQQAKIDNIVHVLGPDAQAILAKRGFDPQTMKPSLPKGGGQAANSGVIQQYLKANGGDKDKTRKALGDAGWVIPKAQ